MCSIKILDPLTANQIAAGEVIEHPASAVKELVENSIDAQASNIKVEIKDGGKTLIKVTDNGNGIHPNEVKLAFKRHATSKILSFDDLQRITSLGFRGEALASIAAVSKVEIFTRTKGNISGVYLELLAGKERLEEERGGPFGTEIIIKDLFYNVPARKKHLKSITAEATAVGNVINSIALANPHLKITYINNGTIVFVSPGNKKLLDTITVLFGNNIANKMVSVSKLQNDFYKVTGYVSLPELTRGNRNGQYFIVNGRHVYNKILNEALEGAYHTLLPKHRFPLAIINIEVAPNLIDVNVHPAKKEIRWVEPHIIKNIIKESVYKAINSKNSIPGIPKLEVRDKNATIKDDSRYNQESFKWKSVIPLVAEVPDDEIGKNIGSKEGIFEDNIKNKREFQKMKSDLYSRKTIQEPLINNESTELNSKQTLNNTDINSFPQLTSLGQIDAMYILAKSFQEKGFFIIDQHAAHERIIYDSLMQKINKAEVISQYLATPIPLELSPAEMSNIVQYMVYIKKLGFCLEHFGDNTYLIRAIPHGLEKLNPEEFLYDLISNELKSINKTEIYHTILQVISCKGAIKAGQKLHSDAINKLLLDLRNTQNPYTCPHGRPTIIHISDRELIKRFYR